MRIWIIKTGEPVPFLPAEAGDRAYRAAVLAQAALDAGHEVVWWTARFSHQKKTHRRVAADTLLQPGAYGAEAGPGLVFLGSPGYRSHIGPGRLWDHHVMARAFRRLAPQQPCPDVILAAYPTVDLAAAAVRFGRQAGVPVVLDVRDFWPDVIYERLNARLPFRTDGMMLPYERMARRAFAGARAVVGISQGAIDWARGRFGGQSPADRPFHHSKHAPRRASITPETTAFWAAKGVDLTAPRTRLVWAGNLVPETDGTTLLAALDALPANRAAELEVVFCGNGALVPRIEALAARAPHVRYAGWVAARELSALTEASHIGLLCYLDRFDFQNAIPNKVVDYCAGAMRVLTNLGGEVPRMLTGSDSVIPYPTGDVAALGAVLTRIATNPAHYRVKHAPARALFDQHFDADKVLPGFVAYLEAQAQG